MGKSTIAKAVLNMEPIVSRFNARLFITYDGIVSSAMTYQVFLDHIVDALCMPASTSASSIIQYLQTLKALLVIDNAETFLGASQNDATLVHRFLEDIGSYPATRIIITTRNTETIPSNLPWHRVDVTGLDAIAAHQAFNAVYPMDPIDSRVAQILSDLGHHPFSINILANAAVMNSWNATQLQEAWEERQTDLLDLAESDKSRSLPATIEISVASFKDSPVILQILQTIAFLPQGVDSKDLHSIFPSLPDISRRTEALNRSSLIYRNGSRLTMLAPIRMYIADRYNHRLPYDSPVLADVRIHYHSKLFDEPYNFIEREHGNIDRFIHFDMTSELYRTNIEIHTLVLEKANLFLFCTIEVVQRSSLWSLLVSETCNTSFNQVDALAKVISLCLARICWVNYRRYEYDDALLKVDVMEKYCCDRGPVCNEGLMACLRLRGIISQIRGNLIVAAKALQQASYIAKSRDDSHQEANLNDSLARILLSQGKVVEAKRLCISAQEYLESNNEHSHLIHLLIGRAHIANFQKDFPNARLLLEKAMKLDHTYNGGRNHLDILNRQASCEGWAGDIAAAQSILEEATAAEIVSGMPQFNDYVAAMRGQAYYHAHTGQLDDARRTFAHVIELQQESGGDWWNVLASACIECCSDGEHHIAESTLQASVNKYDGRDKVLSACLFRTLGEIMLLNGKAPDARAHFEHAKAVCDGNGRSARHLYVNMRHWYSLPKEYAGWTRFLDGAL